VAKHALTHVLDDHFAALYIVSGSLKFLLQLFNLVLLSPIMLFQLVSLFAKFFALVLGLLNLIFGYFILLISIGYGLNFLFFGHFDFMLDRLFVVTSRRLELIELFLCCFQFLLVHFLHVAYLFLTALDCFLQVFDGLDTALGGRLVLEETSF
jgi:hypothetical protein